ncbi:MAG: LysR family transcriptional regulator, partial [Polaromonas sp.]|uniref:LysR family transcriptional regulator n=1 Tax=Polaromonas sp. TaxID=1869339 RepID=UPI00403737A3
MNRLQPPLHLLQAFLATARFGSVSRASESLHLTQSAVSKQISELEQVTGVLLFERIRRRLTLTPAGKRYENALRPVLAQLEAATLDLITSDDGGGALHLSTLPTFGAKWLIPRLPDFQLQHPQIA